ncbi:MAG: hypothetical protein M5U08_05145 [Burkholderiales bacterium]|nr:hypothetical protein [Burkholderiales bacterium]
MPAASITASFAPTATVVPAWTRISFKTPAAGAGISAVTLSVSMSNRFSSALTASPTFLCQATTVPSVTVSPSWGMMTSIDSLSGRLERRD